MVGKCKNIPLRPKHSETHGAVKKSWKVCMSSGTFLVTATLGAWLNIVPSSKTLRTKYCKTNECLLFPWYVLSDWIRYLNSGTARPEKKLNSGIWDARCFFLPGRFSQKMTIWKFSRTLRKITEIAENDGNFCKKDWQKFLCSPIQIVGGRSLCARH